MWYIYLDDETYINTKTEPAEPYATTERMPPRPNKAGYQSVLKADFETNEVWYELVEIPPTDEEIYAKYQALTVLKIREQYSQDDENKVLREFLADNNAIDFETYNAYVLACKAAAQVEIYGETVIETTETVIETEVI